MSRLTVALGLVLAVAVIRTHGQDPGDLRTILYPYSLPAVDRGLTNIQPPAPTSLSTLRRRVRLASDLDRSGKSGTAYVAGRVIVKFRDGTSSAERLNSLASVSPTAAVSERPSYANFDVVRMDASEDAEALADALNRRPEVEYAQPSYRVHRMFVPNDQFYAQAQWNFPLIDLERAWDIQPSAGSTITIAVLDSGLAFENKVIRFNGQAFVDDSNTVHPALGTVDIPFAAAPDIITSGRIVAPHDFIWDDNDPVDLDGHGTHVTGTIGELTNNNLGLAGIAFNAKIMPVKVVDTEWDDIFGSPNQGTDDLVARGIRYAADNGARVINMSIGRSGPPAPLIEDAMRYAVSKGAFIAVAAGNDFLNGNPTEVVAEIASRLPGAVSVGAVDSTPIRAYYSSTGSWVELVAPGGSDVVASSNQFIFQQTLDLPLGSCIATPGACRLPPSLTAPRFDVFDYFGFEGTSMAAPHVSGVAALLMQQGITNPAAVEAALERFAKDLGTKGRDDETGFGLVSARDTLRGLGLAK